MLSAWSTMRTASFLILLCGLPAPGHAQLFERARGATRLEPLERVEYWHRDDALAFEDSDGDQYNAVDGFLNCRPSADQEWRVAVRMNTIPLPGRFTGPAGDRAFFGVPRRGGGNWNVDWWEVDCSEVYDSLAESRVNRTGTYVVEIPGRLPGSIGALDQGSAFELGDRACIASTAFGIWCLNRESEVFELTVDASALPAHIAGADEAHAALFEDYGLNIDDFEQPASASIVRVLTLPSGEVVALAAINQTAAGCSDAGTCVNLRFTTRWVIRLTPSLDFEVVFGPIATFWDEGAIGLQDPMTRPPPVLGHNDATELHYDPEWDALWVGPVKDWNHSTLPAGRYHCDVDVATEHGPVGGGYRIIPLDGSGSGYLDLSEAVIEVTHVQEATGPVAMGPPRCLSCSIAVGFRGAPDQASDPAERAPLLLDVEFAEPRGGNGPGMYRLLLDREGVDLDADGLSAAEERAAGTSDFDADSDDDGLPDGAEAALSLDPQDPAPAPERPFSLVPSLLLFQLDAALGEGRVELNRAPFPQRRNSMLVANTPHCLFFDGRDAGCVSPDGGVLARWPSMVQRGLDPPAFVSVDGAVAVAPEADGLHRVDLATGAREMWLDQEAIRGLWPRPANVTVDPVLADSLYLFPLSADRLLIYPRSVGNSLQRSYQLLEVDGVGQTRVVFDASAAICDSVMSAECDERHAPMPENACFRRQFLEPAVTQGVGFHPASGRVLLGFGGNWDSYLVGLHPSEPPVVIQTARTLLNRELDDLTQWPPPFDYRAMPFVYSPTPDGYFTGTGVLGPNLERRATTPWSMSMLSHAATGARGLHAHAITQTWSSCGHAQLDHLGIEWLAAEQRVNPGDTLLAGYGFNPNRGGLDGVMLWAIGPRGGANPLWDRGRRDLVQVTAMDLAEDGTLCIADRAGQQMLELAPRGDGSGIPDTELSRQTGIDVIDCHYDGDELALLVGDPVRVEFYDRSSGERLRVEEVDPPTPGLIAGELADNADGSFSVLWLGEEGLQGGLVLDDGSLHTYVNGTVSKADGEPIALAGEDIYRAVQRPDGNVISVFSTVRPTPGPLRSMEPLFVAIGEDSETILPATVLTGFFEGTFTAGRGPFALAQVPGGADVDPWTGEERACWTLSEAAPGEGDADLVDGGVGAAEDEASSGGGGRRLRVQRPRSRRRAGRPPRAHPAARLRRAALRLRCRPCDRSSCSSPPSPAPTASTATCTSRAGRSSPCRPVT